ncbi:MAG TPA: transporter substrate-binding domain-containing protein, partial [Propionibacteriaceae bacterium]
MKRLLALSAAVSALALTLTLTGCANYSSSTTAASGSASATGPTLVAAGKLTVCTHLAYKPFQYKDDSNKVVGFDVDLMDVVAKKLGVTQEIVD